MSFRELRNFTEMLRSLGYPRQVSIENFRSPNFKLVAEIIAWLLKRYDPDYDLPLVIDTEQDRVIFIKTAALFLVQKARIKVNPKKLYQADGYAVQELVKVATVLYKAMHQNQFASMDETEDSSNVSAMTSTINAKMSELRASRQIAAEIPEKGASLYDLLSKEVELREQRSTALARPLEIKDIEKSIRASIKAVEEEIKQTLNNLNNISSDEATLDAKIERKKTDLERQQKRLAQLQAVRPAYMDEYEKLEAQLKHMYALYVEKFRNCYYLEQLQNDFDRAERERTMEAEMSLRKMAEKMREEERAKALAAERLETAAAMEAANGDFSDAEEDGKKGPKVYGNITGAGLSEDDEEEDDDESLLSDDDDDDDVDDEELMAEMNAPKDKSSKRKAQKASIDDGGPLSGLSENEGGGQENQAVNKQERPTKQNVAPAASTDSDDDF